MRRWSLTADDPLVLRLAADARFCTPDYLDDQIWELTLRGGEPPAIAVQTTFGLRSRGLRLFPTILVDGHPFADPQHFSEAPVVVALLPNYLRVEAVPVPGLHAVLEYWVPESHVLAGRVTLVNREARAHEVRLRLSAILRPGEDPQAMRAETIQGVTVLTGRSGGLSPVVFLAGGAVADPSPYPSIAVSASLAGGSARSWIWAHAARAEANPSFEAARRLAARSWDAETARLERKADSLVEVETGDPEWDAAFHLTQVVCLGSFVGPTRHLPHAWPVLGRVPDRGFSARGDGRDYGWQWDGLEARTAVYLAQQILPAAPELAQGILRNFLSARLAEGGVDGRPGLARQRGGFLCAPLLAGLAARILAQQGELESVREILPSLRGLFDAWFAPACDRDGDGFPEWDHTLQAGMDDSPTFTRWQAWSQALEISKAETPDLAAFLFREASALRELLLSTGGAKHLAEIESRREDLARGLDAAWTENAVSFSYLDRDSHRSHAGRRLGKGKGSFQLKLRAALEEGGRLIVRVRGPEGGAHAIRVTLHGQPAKGRARSERLTPADFQWTWDFGSATTARVFRRVETVEVAGLTEDFQTEIWLADTTRQEIGQLFPLWAGMVDASRARRMVRRTVLDGKRFWRSFGIPGCSALDPAYTGGEEHGPGAVTMFANCLVGEALSDLGFVNEAAELVTRLMAAAVATLRLEKTTCQAYNPESGAGLGERGHPGGAAPLSLFLHVLGVRFLDAHRVWLRGRNPFPWPVTLRWKGLVVHRLETHSLVTFPNGQEVRIEDAQPQIVEQMTLSGHPEKAVVSGS